MLINFSDTEVPDPIVSLISDQLLCLQLEKLPLSVERALEKVSF